MFNLVVLTGRLTADPELKTTQSGLSVTSFSIAVDRRFRSGEERQTDFINIVAWRQQAEFVAKYFKRVILSVFRALFRPANILIKTGTTEPHLR